MIDNDGAEINSSDHKVWQAMICRKQNSKINAVFDLRVLKLSAARSGATVEDCR